MLRADDLDGHDGPIPDEIALPLEGLAAEYAEGSVPEPFVAYIIAGSRVVVAPPCRQHHAYWQRTFTVLVFDDFDRGPIHLVYVRCVGRTDRPDLSLLG